MNIIPQRDYLLVKVVSANMTKSGLHLVQGEVKGGESVPVMLFAEVVAVSDGFINDNGVAIHVGFQPGDHVAFLPGHGASIHDGKDGFMLVKVPSILARIEGFSEVLDVLGEDEGNG